WKTRYGGRSEALGSTLQIGPTVYTIIGVAPEGFAGLWPVQQPVAFIPITSHASAQRPPRDTWWTTYHWMWASMLVQRKPGVSVAGLLVAEWGGAVLRGQFLARSSQVSVMGDARTLLFGGAAALVAGLLTALAPALQTRRADFAGDLKAGAREGTFQRSRAR